MKLQRLKLAFLGFCLITSISASELNLELYKDAVENPARPAADIERDAKREPQIALAFSQVKPGMKVFDFFTGGGYYAELMANAVGKKGHVIAHNPPKFYEVIKAARGFVEKRQEKNRLSTVSWIDEQPDSLSVKSNSQDLIMSHLVLHDAYWIGGVPQKTLGEFYRILRPGGAIVVIDHAAAKGTGAKDALKQDGIHRIEEAFVIKSLEQAGFKLEAQSDAFRNPKDDRTQAFFSESLRGKKTDRFMIRMRKPK